MIHVDSNDVNIAWRKILTSLLNEGKDTGNDKYLRDEAAIIEIEKPEVIAADPLFPMKQEDLDVINKYIHSGENENDVVHEWTKLYYHRAFDEPNSQIEFLIRNLDSKWPKGEAQISMWDKNVDQDKEVSPCTQIIWARIKNGALEVHVHANSSDAYKKLLMNMLEFISLQKYIADRVNVRVGKYVHFLDSCHIHKKDAAKIREIQENLNK